MQFFTYKGNPFTFFHQYLHLRGMQEIPPLKAFERRIQRRTWSESNEERGNFCPSSTVFPSVH